MKTVVGRCPRVVLVTMTALLLVTGAWGQVGQCAKDRINPQDCWVGLQVSGGTVIATPSDVALHSGAKLSWKRMDTPNPPDKADFAIDFDNHGCTPFGGVFHFDQSSSSPTADQLAPSEFKRCGYKVTIGSLTVDANVIVIGSKPQRGSWGRRHLGQW